MIKERATSVESVEYNGVKRSETVQADTLIERFSTAKSNRWKESQL